MRIPNAAARFEPSDADALRSDARSSDRRGGAGGRRIAALTEELDLSDDQQKELQDKMREMFPRASGAGARRPNAADRQKRMRSLLRSILTDDQWQAYQAGQKNRPQAKTIWVLDESGKPSPRRVRLGIADGSYTEIVSGNLDVGDVAIVRENATDS